MSEAALNLFAGAAEQSGGAPAEVLAGIDQLACAPPLWPVDSSEWLAIIDGVRHFAARWDAEARAFGWTDVELYGLNSRAPWTRVGEWGAAFLIARRAHQVVDISPESITIVT